PQRCLEPAWLHRLFRCAFSDCDATTQYADAFILLLYDCWCIGRSAMAESIHGKQDSEAVLVEGGTADELEGAERLQEISSPLIQQDNGAPRHRTDTNAMTQNEALPDVFQVDAELRQRESDAQTLAALGGSLIATHEQQAIYEQV